MIDNFELIKSLFYFNEANDMFFHLQIVQRAKDHKGENKKVKESAIKTYFIRSREHLDRVREEVIFLCEHYGARAYINVAGKDFSALQNLLLAKLAEYNLNGTVRDPRRMRPFNLQAFHKAFPDVDIHKNSMGTVLYIPNSLNHRYVCSECGSPNIQVQAWGKC